MSMLQKFHKYVPGSNLEECHYFDLAEALSRESEERIRFLLSEPGALIGRASFLEGPVDEAGTRIARVTSHSSRAVEILRNIGIGAIRVEMSVRVPRWREAGPVPSFDPMTQEIYPAPLTSFGTNAKPESMRVFRLSEGGDEMLRAANAAYGYGIQEADFPFFLSLFEQEATDAALALLGNAMSDHSRHGTVKGRYMIDGVWKEKSIFDLVRDTWKANPNNNLVAFHDNAGVMRGNAITMLMPEIPGEPSRFVRKSVTVHITITAETHNHPCFRAPVPGAETGVGGLMRDKEAQGRGALFMGMLCAGYATSNLTHRVYRIPGETIHDPKSIEYATGLEAMIGMSNGASDYANKMGCPITFGFCRTFDKIVEGRRRGWVKPICYVGGVARVDERHVLKNPAEVGMLIVGCGGAAQRIGVGGGAASSVEGGLNKLELDFASVQRADAIVESCANRALKACAELGDHNPIEDLSDQGAGGPGNLFLELVGKLGGSIDLERIRSADPTLTPLEKLIGEYQERYGFLIRKENLPLVENIFERESVHLEVLGEITGNGRFLVMSGSDLVVDLSIEKTLAKQPRKEFVWDHLPRTLAPLEIPQGLTVRSALEMVLAQVCVGSKHFLTRKGDRSVGGLVVQQQCVGPKQVAVADVAVMADSFSGFTGSASALGEQPIVGLVDAKAGGRQAAAEALTNICAAHIEKIPAIECRVNEMWAAKQPGEGALLYDAVEAASELMAKLKFLANGGKDSLAMAAKTAAEEMVVAPGQLVIFATAPMRDVRKVLTPELQGERLIGLVDIGQGKNRLGGSAFAQALDQVGNEAPDINDVDLLDRALAALQEMISKDLISAYHDRTGDGGLITALVEMCLAGNRGAHIDILDDDMWSFLFNQEAGYVFEFRKEDGERIADILADWNIGWVSRKLGRSGSSSERSLVITDASGTTLLNESVVTLRQWWERTSDEMELLQANPETVREEIESYADDREIPHRLTFVPMPSILTETNKPKVAVVRAPGTNGDREMVGVLEMVGFEVTDVAMKDLFDHRIVSFDPFRAIMFPGGFADGDTFGSAKGWASSILHNPRIKEMFDRFYERSDTFSLGVCNGCQLSTLIGWVPGTHIPLQSQPRLVRNRSKRFDSRTAALRIEKSPAICFKGMEGSIIPVHNAHGEGQFRFDDPAILQWILDTGLVPVVFVDNDGEPTEKYPYNPNGSVSGIAGLCSANGRHVAMMSHPERCFMPRQFHYLPREWRSELEASPWLRMFQNILHACQ